MSLRYTTSIESGNWIVSLLKMFQVLFKCIVFIMKHVQQNNMSIVNLNLMLYLGNIYPYTLCNGEKVSLY